MAHGTSRISNYPTKPPGKTTLLGLRYANWVSLESVDGRRLSIVSTHVSPSFKDAQGDWVDLLRPSVRRIGSLVEDLSRHGPVLIGGDYNVNYVSGRYPRDLLDAAKMRPTYDLLGTQFPTGDHHGGTIDYAFVRGKGQVQVDWHRPVELNSDHDAVVAGLSWTTPAPEPADTVVTNQPDGTAQQRTAVLRTLRQNLADTAGGETVQLATRGLSLRLVARALRKADARAVRVQVTTLSPRLTFRERSLMRTLDTRGSWLRRCRDACRTQWQAEQPASLLLVSDANGNGKVRIDVSRRLSPAVVSRRTSARISKSQTPWPRPARRSPGSESRSSSPGSSGLALRSRHLADRRDDGVGVGHAHAPPSLRPHRPAEDRYDLPPGGHARQPRPARLPGTGAGAADQEGGLPADARGPGPLPARSRR